jgi:hypothetical protein
MVASNHLGGCRPAPRVPLAERPPGPWPARPEEGVSAEAGTAGGEVDSGPATLGDGRDGQGGRKFRSILAGSGYPSDWLAGTSCYVDSHDRNDKDSYFAACGSRPSVPPTV